MKSVSLSQFPVDRLAFFALLFGAGAIAFSPIFVRLSDLDPLTSAFYRPFLALPILFLWVAGQNRRSKSTRVAPRRRDYLILGLSGLFFAGDLGFWHWSIALTSIANSTLLANFAPIFVALGAYFIFGQSVSRGVVIGMLLSLMGALLLMGDSLVFRPEHLLGDALGITTAVFYAAYILTVGRLRSRFSTATIMAWSSLSTVVVLLPIAAIFGDGFIPATPAGWGPLIGLALVAHAGGQGLIAFALAHLSSTLSSIGLLFQPVIAALLGWMLFNEAVGFLQAVGAAIILAGIYQARRASR